MKPKSARIVLAFSLVFLCASSCQNASPKTAEDYFEAAQINLDAKDYGAAIRNLTEALAQDPSDAETWNSRAYAYFFLGQYENAIADYTETLRIEPEMGVAWVFRSQAYTQTGEHEKAAADMETIKRLIADQKENQIKSNKGY